MYAVSVFATLDVMLLYQDATTAAFVMPWNVPPLCTRQYSFLPDPNTILLLNPLGNSALAQATKSWIVEAVQPLHYP